MFGLLGQLNYGAVMRPPSIAMSRRIGRRRLKKIIDLSGWLLFCATIAGTLGVLHLEGPRWAANALVAVAFLTSVALIRIGIRKRWEDC